MFGRKKEKVKTFIDGVEQDSDEIPVPQPKTAELPSDATALEPQAVQEPSPQPEVQQFDGECILCFDFGWYADQLGVWHNCPRCNKDGKNNIPGKQAISSRVSSDEDRPSKGNLYEFRECVQCGARNEVHKKKKKWQCEECGKVQEGGESR